MISVDSQRHWLQQHLAHAHNRVPGNSPAWLMHVREQASRAISELPVLDRKQEAWRYSSIEGLLKQRFQHSVEPTVSVDDVQARDIQQHFIADLDAYRLVLINGQYAPHLSDLQGLPLGVTLDSVRAVLSTNPDMLATWFGQTAQHNENVFTALNTALMHDGVFLHVGSKVKLDRPIEVIYLGKNDNEHSILFQPRNLVVLEDAASATLIERFIGDGAAKYFHNHLAEITIGKSASLNHYRIQDEGRQAYHLSNVFLSQQTKSHYHGTTLSFGGAWNRTEYHATFKEENAQCVLNGLTLVGDKQFSDFHLKVYHRVPGCVSREQFKGVLYGAGRAVFDGYIRVDKHAQRSDAQLTNDNLLLTRNAEVDTKPQLEIYADDVKCSHGTTVGELDPNQVYYLRSRGIDEATARKMLCLGFAKNIIDTVLVPALQRDALEKISNTLGARRTI